MFMLYTLCFMLFILDWDILNTKVVSFLTFFIRKITECLKKETTLSCRTCVGHHNQAREKNGCPPPFISPAKERIPSHASPWMRLPLTFSKQKHGVDRFVHNLKNTKYKNSPCFQFGGNCNFELIKAHGVTTP